MYRPAPQAQSPRRARTEQHTSLTAARTASSPGGANTLGRVASAHAKDAAAQHGRGVHLQPHPAGAGGAAQACEAQIDGEREENAAHDPQQPNAAPGSGPTRAPPTAPQFPGRVHPADLDFGQTKLKGHATFGMPNGMNAVPTTKFTRSHEKEPILPEREAVLGQSALLQLAAAALSAAAVGAAREGCGQHGCRCEMPLPPPPGTQPRRRRTRSSSSSPRFPPRTRRR